MEIRHVVLHSNDGVEKLTDSLNDWLDSYEDDFINYELVDLSTSIAYSADEFSQECVLSAVAKWMPRKD